MRLSRRKVYRKVKAYRPPKERLLVGIDELAAFLSVSTDWFYKRPAWDPERKTRMERLAEAGAVFLMKHGRPPRAMWCGFPQLIKAYILKQTDNYRRVFDG